jgi:hypothetical protein
MTRHPPQSPARRRWKRYVGLLGVFASVGLLGCGAVDEAKPVAVDARPAWTLALHHPGSEARLETSPDRPDLLSVAIVRAEDPTAFNIQLNEPGIGVKAGESYRLAFRARANGPRPILYGISMAHAPWLGLGFYREAALTTDWKEFSEVFSLASNDDNARLHFDLGASPESVQFESVTLRHEPSGALVGPGASAR